MDKLKRGDWTALMHAVAHSELHLVGVLLQYNADISQCNKDGWNSIHLAVRTGNTDLVNLLKQHSQTNNLLFAWLASSKNGRTILHIAAMHSHVHLAKLFLDEAFIPINIEFDSKDVCGVTPFMDAARVDCLEICRLLWQHSDERIDVDQTDKSGRSALHMAAQANALNVIDYLVNYLKCDINKVDLYNQTTLFLAVREGHELATKFLFELGAKQTLDAKNRSLMQIAQQYGHDDLFKYLS